MDGVARLPDPERAVLFREAANRSGSLSDLVVEKDFWVCWTLKRVFASEGVPPLLFKGGTSLSKGFGLIERFSEDVDLAFDRRALGFGGANDPANKPSLSGSRKAVKALMKAAVAYVAGPFLHLVRREFAEALGAEAQLAVDPESPDTLLFHYPQAVPAGAVGRYISPMVRMEMGARSDPKPSRTVTIRSYAAERVPEFFESPACEVVVQAPERTLVEKALILHSTNQRSAHARERISRHVYDLALMHRAGLTAAVDRALVEEVARHKLIFADDKAASRAPSEGFRLVPDEEAARDLLRRDYRRMEEMFFRDPPEFDDLLSGIADLERALNALL